MTTHRTYSCTLCRDPIMEPSDGIGLSFTSVDSTGRYHDAARFRTQPMHQCETHLCRTCVQGLTLLIQKGAHHVIA